jgi:predicted nucleotidyltransferase
MGELSDRRAQTVQRLKALDERLKDAAAIAQGKACVYATGSFGRCEASRHSDLDLFIVGKNEGVDEVPNRKRRSLLRTLDEIRIKADLIEATAALGIPEFSGDGRYLTHYSVDDLTKTLGTREDDVTNTFTARLLLLLESRPLLGGEVYQNALEEVLATYWRDYTDHKSDFIPAFLANDILRLWRTFCVNYEAGTERVPEEQKAKGKLKNYKLKHSRMLTCYSALLFLLAIYGKEGSASPDDALRMIALTPTERLEWLRDQPHLADAKETIVKLLDQYEQFLAATNAEEKELIKRFQDRNASRQYAESAHTFGNLMFDALIALSQIGDGNRFYRLLVV